MTKPCCAFCGKSDAPAQCSKCLVVWYCNQACQLNDYAEHKKTCKKPTKASPNQDNTSPVASNKDMPIRANDTDFSNPSKFCIARIHTDLKALSKDPLDGIYCEQDEEKVNVCHAIIVGPSDTPYELGFFYFLVEVPDQYPHVPPRVTLQTTGGGKVRFNPNLYANGKVCLSVLGTWHGPAWSPAQNIGSVLLSIRSLLNSQPLYNEPGFEGKPPQESKAYNRMLRHETLRIAVLDLVTHCHDVLPERLAQVVSSLFFDFCEVYKYTCDEYSFLDGQSYCDPLWPTNRGTFGFAQLKELLEKMQEEMEINRGEAGADGDNRANDTSTKGDAKPSSSS